MKRRLIILCVSLLSIANAHAEWIEHVEDGIMGTRIVVELWSEDRAKGNDAVQAVLAEMRRVDEAMSTYKPTSALSLVNAQAATRPVQISQELFDLLATSIEYSKITQGAFDITYASVGYMYDYRERASRHQLSTSDPRSRSTHREVCPPGSSHRSRRHW